jgi:phosphatidylserine/phosphatidylglycerophosphate/cardiolipin synthase-like enzyme
MRKRTRRDGLTVNAIAGTHVVHPGFDLDEAQRAGCLGFALQREDHTEDEKYWMSGMKTFAATDPGGGPGGQVSSREQPFQSFQWADYSAKPEHDYTYRVLPLYGQPDQLAEGGMASVRLTTEGEAGTPHAVFFNRGAVASQEYARRFMNEDPDEAGEPAFKWLSRELFEAFVAFVGRADGPSYELFGAVYEFQWAGALEAIRAASQSGAAVHVLYDGIPGNGPGARNLEAIEAAGIADLCQPRTTGKLMHNKFFVLVRDGAPIAVWTGSTNLTENGIFGHSNCGHAVEDGDLAAAYLAYWHELAGNPASGGEKDWMDDHNPAPPDPWSADLVEVFSPHRGLKVLEWYAAIAASASKGLFMTFAFGMHKDFQQVYEQRDGVLRFALMEKEDNGSGLAQGKKDISRIRRLPNVVVAVGNNIVTNSFDRWLGERQALTKEANVRYVHTKYMLVDPLADEPVVVSGSANFSEASTNTNNENMLVIRGDTRVADIYLGEFMRLHSHYAFREAVKIAKEKGETDWQPSRLVPDDTWQRDYFKAGHPRALRRTYFAGG